MTSDEAPRKRNRDSQNPPNVALEASPPGSFAGRSCGALRRPEFSAFWGVRPKPVAERPMGGRLTDVLEGDRPIEAPLQCNVVLPTAASGTGMGPTSLTNQAHVNPRALIEITDTERSRGGLWPQIVQTGR